MVTQKVTKSNPHLGMDVNTYRKDSFLLQQDEGIQQFKAIRLKLSSPESIIMRSYGEVTKAETINYRTLRPEKDGLFCERIFGPTKDWECYCGKYKKFRHKGVVCDRCGVEVTRSHVRRERMGHIKLAAPVAHIWFFKGAPSYISMLLDIPPKNLEQVIYFSRYAVTDINEEKRAEIDQQLKEQLKSENQYLSKMPTSLTPDEIQEQTEKALTDLEDYLSRAEAKAIYERAEPQLRIPATCRVTSITEMDDGYTRIQVQHVEVSKATHPKPATHHAVVKTGSMVKKGQIILSVTRRALASGDELTHPKEICATVSGKIKVTKTEYSIEPTNTTESNKISHEYLVHPSANAVVLEGEELKPGVPIATASDLDRLLKLRTEYVNYMLSDLHDLTTQNNGLNTPTTLLEGHYDRLIRKFGRDLFTASMGAETLLTLLKDLDLDALKNRLERTSRLASGHRNRKMAKRLRMIEAIRKSGNKPEWMILTVLPVLPPDLHPMVQLDGGRFATSDLNELYRRVINRNNRLKTLLEPDKHTPGIIIRNEKRMLQEVVDNLIDNGRRGHSVQGSHNNPLKSLADLLRGKQGRFRQNLLGKRVDYSGRSVIVAGPFLRLNQCGLPKKMALELFKPFVIYKLMLKQHAHNIKAAKRLVEHSDPRVWNILEEVVKDHPVLLNRAPTLHRLGIQAFNVVLVDGSAIRLHPLVCTAYNADFDGDQMAVHVPLSSEARIEAKKLMLSTNNLLAPRSGDPIVAPTLDMVLGIYYLTEMEKPPADAGVAINGSNSVDADGNGVERNSSARLPRFANFDDAVLALDLEQIRLRQPVVVRAPDGENITTTAGRIIFNRQLPAGTELKNQLFSRREVEDLVAECHARNDATETVEMLDRIKDIGFKYATESGTTIAVTDVSVPAHKANHLAKADAKIETLEGQFLDGLISKEDKYRATVKVWTEVSDAITKEVEAALPSYGGIYTMAASGAKGNIAQIKQMAGIRGLMSNPRGRIIEMPIRSSFTEGLSVMEYFISTHGTRKGLADTALRTADAGYLTRRLADVAQDVIILHANCAQPGTPAVGIDIDYEPDMPVKFVDRIVTRYLSASVVNSRTGEIIADVDELVTPALAQKIQDAGVKSVNVRSPLSCNAPSGICSICYGLSLATNRPSMMGEAVGIIAAQSVGEPGTQLTMRTFHTGGVAGQDITSGLPRVVELFEARVPRGVAPMTEIGGKVTLLQTLEGGRDAQIYSTNQFSREVPIPKGYKATVKSGDEVFVGDVILKKRTGRSVKEPAAANLPDEYHAESSGTVKITRSAVKITWQEDSERIYHLPHAARILVEDGQTVEPGQVLTSGPKDPREILRILGARETQKYMVNEVQAVYKSQGVRIHDKHIEIIIRQIMQKVEIENPGASRFMQQELVSKRAYAQENARIKTNNGVPATARPLLLGVTRAALSMDSFLAAASFQETARVLTEAALSGAVDRLQGLKENVIIGNLIPARLDITPEGREFLGFPEQLSSLSVNNGEGMPPSPSSYQEALAQITGNNNNTPEPEPATDAGIAVIEENFDPHEANSPEE